MPPLTPEEAKDLIILAHPWDHESVHKPGDSCHYSGKGSTGVMHGNVTSINTLFRMLGTSAEPGKYYRISITQESDETQSGNP